jgi:hypothetical protein
VQTSIAAHFAAIIGRIHRKMPLLSAKPRLWTSDCRPEVETEIRTSARCRSHALAWPFSPKRFYRLKRHSNSCFQRATLSGMMIFPVNNVAKGHAD